jgi:beta-glucanase (GH16 family)
MKKFLIFIALNIFAALMFSQTVPLGIIFPNDTIGTNGGRMAFGSEQLKLRVVNDTMFINAGLDFLAINYNSDNIDSLGFIADTILYRNGTRLIYDSTETNIIDSLPEVFGFYWKKSVQFTVERISNPFDSYKCWKNRPFCTMCKYEKHLSHGSRYLCNEIETCDYQTDHWCSDNTYTKVFEDNFEGTKLDENHWIYTHLDNSPTYSIPFNKNVEVNFNSAVNSGTLKLTAEKHVTRPYYDTDGSLHNDLYSCGAIKTMAHFNFGKFEIRAKIPNVYGTNPSYWIVGEHYEMDGFEFFLSNENDMPTMTLYSDANYGSFHSECNTYDHKVRVNQWTAKKITDSGGPIWTNLPDLSTDFHTYVLIWDPNFITWQIDDQWFLTTYRKNINLFAGANPQTFCGCTSCQTVSQPQFPTAMAGLQLVLDNAVWETRANNITGNPKTQGPDAGSNSVFEIDWVKVYQKNNCGHNTNLVSEHPYLITNHQNQSNLTADVITLGGGGTPSPFIVDYDNTFYTNSDNINLFARANQEIQLKDGFQVPQPSYPIAYPTANGSVFEATIAYDGRYGGPTDCQDNNNFWTQWLRSSNNANQTNSTATANLPIKNIVNQTGIGSVSNDKELKGLKVYPNPAQEELFISGLKKYQYLEILNSTLQSVSITLGMQEKIDISQLESGLYFLRIYCDNTVIIRKFIKE